ncbi:MAG: protein kinase family protein [Gammaproteobacteria bacterium]|nr:protein kinase family protein [Gammaproteobacteria bacterium]
MSSSHMRIVVSPEQKEVNLLTKEQIKFVKTVLKDEPSYIFSTMKLTKLINNYLNQSNEQHVEIPYRILKVKSEKVEYDKYYAVDKGVKSGKALGAGAEGAVKRIVDLDTGEEYALKVVKLRDDHDDRGMEEWEANYQFEIMKKIGVAHAVQLNKSISNDDMKERATKRYMIMTLAKGKNLNTLLRDHVDEKIHVSIHEWIKICLSALEAENELYNNMGVLHRDIKLENLIYDPVSEKVTLVDFGCACFHKNKFEITNDERSLGTTGYQAPEVAYPEEDKNPSYSEKSEVYALGHMFQEILGFEDFEEPIENHGVIRNVITNDELRRISPELYQQIETLTNKMKNESPVDRPVIKDVIGEFKKLYSTYLPYVMKETYSPSMYSSTGYSSTTPASSSQSLYPPSPMSDSRLFSSPSPSSERANPSEPKPEDAVQIKKTK